MIPRFYNEWLDIFDKNLSWKDFTVIGLTFAMTAYDVTLNAGLLGFCFSLEIER